jgi:hypothetical protein
MKLPSRTGRNTITGAPAASRRGFSAVGGFLLCFLLALVLAAPASADNFIYTYQGNPLTTFMNGYACSPGPCEIEGSFTVATQLSAGLNGATITPTSYSFDDDNGFVLNPCGATCAIDVTGIGTDALGNIDAWDVQVFGCFGHCIISTTGPGGSSGDTSTEVSPPPVEATNVGTPGTWTCQDMGPTGALSPCPVAPPVQTPESGSLFLFAAGLLALVGLSLVGSTRTKRLNRSPIPFPDFPFIGG